MSILRKELLIIKKPSVKGDDPGVAEFGPTRPRKEPHERNRQPDAADSKAQVALKKQGIARAVYFSYGIGDPAQIQVLFPNAEHYKDQPFDIEHWDRFGNLESELPRVNLMLENYGRERGFPQEFEPYLTTAQQNSNVLKGWKAASLCVAQAAEGIYTKTKKEMIAKKTVDPEAASADYKEAYQSRPILYTTTSATLQAEQALWSRALTQVTQELQTENYQNVRSFLDLYTRIKDPITPVTQNLPEQVRHFSDLFRQARSELRKQGIIDMTTDQGKALVTQLALEASFLALPATRDIFYVRGDGLHHQLPYVYTDLKDLPRGEYTSPDAVIPRLKELLTDAEQHRKVMITPIAVSYFQTPGERKPSMFVIDGNNRATSLMVLQYLYEENPSFTDRFNKDTIQRFMKRHKLHPGWEREIYLTLHSKDYTDEQGVLHEGFTEDTYNRIMTDKKRLKKLVEARVPAILVQEPSFHTIEVENSNKYKPDIYLLQPMHQAIYNHDELAMAIPPKQQTHGRAPGNNILIEATRAPRLGIRRKYKLKEQHAA